MRVVRRIVIGHVALVLLAACDSSDPSRVRVPTLECDIRLPPGWRRAPEPMPDHILEAHGPGADGRRSWLVLRESAEATLTAAAAALRVRMNASSVRTGDVVLVRDEAFGGGHVLEYGDGTIGRPVRRLFGFVSLAGRVVMLVLEQPSEHQARPVLDALATLHCRSR